MSTWAPMFAARLGIGPTEIASLSIPAMVDHVSYLDAMRGSVPDGG